tara:strand:+ start:7365 stop:7940 length:576 start_codon:yes stop_codon:yes gene_type:complete
MPKLTAAEVQKILTTDGRTKLFKEKLKKLGYVKDAKNVSKVMEKVKGDFAMMSDAGNKKIARAVAKSKSEKELRQKIDKISTMSGGKYSEAQEDEVIQRAIDAFNSKASGTQLRPDANMLMQLRKFKDTKKNGEVRADDMKSIKVKHQDAVKVHDVLMSVKAPIRDKYTRLLQKDSKSFKKTFNDILKIAS